MADVGVPMRDNRGYIPWSKIQNLITSPDRWGKRTAKRDKMLLYTLAFSGRRISEVVRGPKNKTWLQYGIRRRDIDESEMFIHFVILKKKERKRQPIPVPAMLVRDLLLYCQTNNIREDGWVFPITRQRADQIVKFYANKVGLVNIGSDDAQRNKPHCHHFRHSLAVHMAKHANSPMDGLIIQEMLQHSFRSTTDHYFKYGRRDVRKFLDRLFRN